MELYKEILIEILGRENVRVDFPNLKADISEIIEAESYKALKKIKEIIEDNSLDDRECFERIENIIRVFEDINSDGGRRHDFG